MNVIFLLFKKIYLNWGKLYLLAIFVATYSISIFGKSAFNQANFNKLIFSFLNSRNLLVVLNRRLWDVRQVFCYEFMFLFFWHIIFLSF